MEKMLVSPIIDKERTGQRIKKMMAVRNLTVKDIKDYLGLGSLQSIYHWLEGKTIPSVDNLLALSFLFNVSMDDLICCDRQRPKDYILISEKPHIRWQIEKIHGRRAS